MKIAIPIVDGQLCLHFGHCAHFALVDVDEVARKVTASKLVEPPPHEPGVLPKWLHEQGATVILAGVDADSIGFVDLNALLDEFKGVLLRGKGVLRGRHLELVNGTYIWTEDAPDDVGEGLFFALKGDAATVFSEKIHIGACAENR